MQVLRQTRAEHRSLVDRLQIADSLLTRARYAKLLNRMLGVLVPLERSVEALPAFQAALPDLTERRKAQLVELDLEQLGGDLEAPPCPWLPPLTDVPRAFGATFVIEHLVRGGPLLAAQIRRTIGEDAPAGFLCCYGEGSLARWRTFASALDEAVHDARIVVQSARATYHAIESWLDQEDELLAVS